MKYENIVFLNKNYRFMRGSISVENDIITDIEEYEPSNERGIIPPFTDIHIHGGYGVDIMDGDSEGICYLAQKLKEDNVGMWLPTTVAKDFESILRTARAVKKAAQHNSGAEIAGIHIEGPFISKEYKGIMEEKYIVPCDKGLYDDLRDILGDMVIRFTIAPEAEGAEEFCSYVTQNAGHISMGHSKASAKCCEKLSRAGAESFTHLFNAMAQLHHRDENILSYALGGSEYCEIIADEIHILPQILSLALNITGSRAVLVTDALKGMGMGNESFEFCGTQINIINNRAVNHDGRLAGSILKLKDALQNASKYIGYENAVKLACENPAKLINKFDKIGSIEIGKKLFPNITD